MPNIIGVLPSPTPQPGYVRDPVHGGYVPGGGVSIIPGGTPPPGYVPIIGHPGQYAPPSSSFSGWHTPIGTEQPNAPAPSPAQQIIGARPSGEIVQGIQQTPAETAALARQAQFAAAGMIAPAYGVYERGNVNYPSQEGQQQFKAPSEALRQASGEYFNYSTTNRTDFLKPQGAPAAGTTGQMGRFRPDMLTAEAPETLEQKFFRTQAKAEVAADPFAGARTLIGPSGKQYAADVLTGSTQAEETMIQARTEALGFEARLAGQTIFTAPGPVLAEFGPRLGATLTGSVPGEILTSVVIGGAIGAGTGMILGAVGKGVIGAAAARTISPKVVQGVGYGLVAAQEVPRYAELYATGAPPRAWAEAGISSALGLAGGFAGAKMGLERTYSHVSKPTELFQRAEPSLSVETGENIILRTRFEQGGRTVGRFEGEVSRVPEPEPKLVRAPDTWTTAALKRAGEEPGPSTWLSKSLQGKYVVQKQPSETLLVGQPIITSGEYITARPSRFAALGPKPEPLTIQGPSWGRTTSTPTEDLLGGGWKRITITPVEELAGTTSKAQTARETATTGVFIGQKTVGFDVTRSRVAYNPLPEQKTTFLVGLKRGLSIEGVPLAETNIKSLTLGAVEERGFYAPFKTRTSMVLTSTEPPSRTKLLLIERRPTPYNKERPFEWIREVKETPEPAPVRAEGTGEVMVSSEKQVLAAPSTLTEHVPTGREIVNIMAQEERATAVSKWSKGGVITGLTSAQADFLGARSGEILSEQAMVQRLDQRQAQKEQQLFKQEQAMVQRLDQRQAQKEQQLFKQEERLDQRQEQRQETAFRFNVPHPNIPIPIGGLRLGGSGSGKTVKERGFMLRAPRGQPVITRTIPYVKRDPITALKESFRTGKAWLKPLSQAPASRRAYTKASRGPYGAALRWPRPGKGKARGRGLGGAF